MRPVLVTLSTEVSLQVLYKIHDQDVCSLTHSSLGELLDPSKHDSIRLKFISTIQVRNCSCAEQASDAYLFHPRKTTIFLSFWARLLISRSINLKFLAATQQQEM